MLIFVCRRICLRGAHYAPGSIIYIMRKSYKCLMRARESRRHCMLVGAARMRVISSSHQCVATMTKCISRAAL